MIIKFIWLTVLANGIIRMKSSRTLQVGNELDTVFSVKDYGAGERDPIFFDIHFMWDARYNP